MKDKSYTNDMLWIRDDPQLLGDSGEVPISEWNGWQFNSRCEIFSSLDGKKLGK